MAKATEPKTDTPPAGQPARESGADPGLKVAPPRPDKPAEPGTQRVQLSQHWTDPVTGENHPPETWVTVDDQLAADLDMSGYLLRNKPDQS